MGNNETVRFTKEAENIIGSLNICTSLPGRLDYIITNYGAFMDTECPELTANEWCCIMDVLSGISLVNFAERPEFANMLVFEIEESSHYGYGEKWSIDAMDLVHRIGAMRYVQKCAIIEAACRFWADDNDEQSIEESLAACGAKVRK